MPRLSYDTPRVVIEVVVASAVVGAVVGGLWSVLAPDVVGVAGEADGEIGIGIVEAADVFSREAVLASLCTGAGIVLALYYSVRFRMRPVSTLLALVCGGALGTAVAVGVGMVLDPSGGSVAAGEETVAPLILDAYGLLAGWPLAASIVVFVVALVRDDRNPWGNAPSQVRPMGATTPDVN